MIISNARLLRISASSYWRLRRTLSIGLFDRYVFYLEKTHIETAARDVQIARGDALCARRSPHSRKVSVVDDSGEWFFFVPPPDPGPVSR